MTTFDLEAELKKQTEATLAAVREALIQLEDDPDFEPGIALLRLKASFLDKKVIL